MSKKKDPIEKMAKKSENGEKRKSKKMSVQKTFLRRRKIKLKR